MERQDITCHFLGTACNTPPFCKGTSQSTRYTSSGDTAKGSLLLLKSIAPLIKFQKSPATFIPPRYHCYVLNTKVK